MATRVIWPSSTDTHAFVWRLLEYLGMAKGALQAGRYTMSGYVFLDGNMVQNKKTMVRIGREFTLELRVPGRLVDSREVIVVTNNFLSRTPNRVTGPYEF